MNTLLRSSLTRIGSPKLPDTLPNSSGSRAAGMLSKADIVINVQNLSPMGSACVATTAIMKVYSVLHVASSFIPITHYIASKYVSYNKCTPHKTILTTCIVTQRWTGKFFQPERLGSLGLCAQFGHTYQEKCPCPDVVESFVIFDVTGIHEVSVGFCSCTKAETRNLQLLRRGWFSETSVNPCVAATFRLLEHYTVLSSLTALSVENFYGYLIHITGKTDCDLSPLVVSSQIRKPMDKKGLMQVSLRTNCPRF